MLVGWWVVLDATTGASLKRELQLTYLSVFDVLKQNNMSVSPCGEMLLRNKEPFVTKNKIFRDTFL